MKVTYIPVVSLFDFDTIGGRIVSSTLLSQGIDIHINPIIYKIQPEKTWEGFGYYHAAFFQNLWNHQYDDLLKEEIKNMYDIVLLSVNDMNYTYIIHRLLKAGKKVVIGGSTVHIQGFKKILDTLVDYFGHDVIFLARNLIAVKGMIDKSTDLKSIIENWRTVEIKENNFNTIYDCDYKWADHDITQFVFKFQCPWMKCTFCNRLNLPTINFTKNVRVEKINSNLKKVAGDGPIKVVDDYFLFTPKMLDVLKNVKNDLEIQTGVKELTKPDYIENCNKYITKIKFGLESMTNYSLKAMRKEQNFEMINRAVDNIIEYGDPKKLHIQPFWIVDTPQRNVDMVKSNYDRLSKFRQRFIDAGFKFSVYPSFMYLTSNDELSKSQWYGYESENEYLVGISRIFQKTEKIDYGLVRYDESGMKMKSDMEIIDEGMLNSIFLDYLKE